MYQTIESAQEVCNRFQAANPDALNVRVERRQNGEFRAVHDHLISVGRAAADKSHAVTRKLIAGWGVNVTAHL